MITLDRIKIKASNKYLLEQKVTFNQTYDPNHGTKKGEFYCSKDDPEIPFNLYIAVSDTQKKLTVEFSSKILGEDYPLLISRKTIRRCLENLNELGICTVDVDGILETGAVNSMDVTVDIPYLLTDDDLTDMTLVVMNYRRYKWSHYYGDGITFKSDVKSSDCVDSMIVYLKNKEIGKTANKKFLKSIRNSDNVRDYFKDKTRFEVSLDSEKKIKGTLGTNNLYLHHILSLDNQCILKVFDFIFANLDSIPKISECSNYNELAMETILKMFNGDLKMIDFALRGVYKSRNGRTDKMKQIAAYKIATECSEAPNRVAKIREWLADCINEATVAF